MDEVWLDDSLLCFDGRVLEVFGFPGSESIRFHVRNVRVQVGDPDRKGRRRLTITASRGSGGCSFEVQPEQWPQIAPLLERVFAAMPGP